MNVRKVINERFRRRAGGLDIAADINAVVAANVGENGQTTQVSSRQTASAKSGDGSRRTSETKEAS